MFYLVLVPADSVNVFYITVDPERDTPDVMKRFLEKYPRYTGLTGTKEQIDAIRKEFHIFAKVKGDQEAPVNIPRAILGLPRNELHLNSGGIWGWVPAWACEMGDEETKNALLSYADKHFHPKVRDGGLMYPRNDQVFDLKGNFTMVSPILSNALMPLTRLNVRHGLKRFYEEPWGGVNRAHYGEPGLVDVDFEVDVY
ncbi:hypothetical protein BDW69DRAFT_186058 [Aspergillus filifer]